MSLEKLCSIQENFEGIHFDESFKMYEAALDLQNKIPEIANFSRK